MSNDEQERDREELAALETPKLPKGIAPGSEPVLTFCIGCGIELSRVSLGGTVTIGGESGMIVLAPLRCPECNEALLWRKQSRVLRTRPGQIS